jgi:hypothetical protein
VSATTSVDQPLPSGQTRSTAGASRTESTTPSQARRIFPSASVATCGADELACKPDLVASQGHDQLRAACCWRAISPGKPRSIAEPRDPGVPQVEPPDHAPSTVFQAGAPDHSDYWRQSRPDHRSSVQDCTLARVIVTQRCQRGTVVQVSKRVRHRVVPGGAMCRQGSGPAICSSEGALRPGRESKGTRSAGRLPPAA